VDSRTTGTDGLETFVQAAPGLEPALAAELRELGLSGTEESGGVTLEADIEGVARLNLHLASASRVLVTLGTFRATALGELERKAATLPWDTFLTPGTPPDFAVTCRKSRLYHTTAVAERLARASGGGGVAPSGGGVAPSGGDAAPRSVASGADSGGSKTPGAGATTRFVVRIVRDRVTIRADSSGEHLHRRGYRRATAKAPLRETLAAGVLRLVGWRPERPLIDPLCGAGTFVIEAALRACRRAPGENRTFAFEHWPGADPDLVRRLRAEALARVRRPPAPLAGSDRDAGAVASAIANAERAGVAGAVHFERRALSAAVPPEGTGPGLLIANPPWGRRVGDERRLRDLYARLGRHRRTAFPGWDLAFLCPSERLARQVDPGIDRIARFPSGGVQVGLWFAGGS
jgi:putative N6-adenine-specific DNA methylase